MVVFWAPIVTSAVAVVVFLLILLAAIVDMRRHVRKKSPQPTDSNVTIIIYSQNANSLERCLNSIFRDTDQQCDVVVVDALPKNDHRAIKLAAHAQRHTVLYRPRLRHDRQKLLRLAYGRSRKASAVIITHDSIRFNSDTLARSVAARLLKVPSKPVRLQTVYSAGGFLGVVVSLRASMIGLIDTACAVLRIRRQLNIKDQAYVVSAHSIKKSTVFDRGWGYDSHVPALLGTYAGIVRPFTIKGALTWLVFSLLFLVGYGLIVASISRDKADVFIFVWLLLSLMGTAAILFDPFLRVSDKFRSLVCVGFMPILMLIAVVVRARSN